MIFRESDETVEVYLQYWSIAMNTTGGEMVVFDMLIGLIDPYY